MFKYPAKYEKEVLDGEDWFVIEFFDLKNTATQARTFDGLMEMAQDVLSLQLDSMLEDGDEIPVPSTREGEDIVYIAPYPETEIALIVKHIREESGLTQKEAAEKAGMPWQSIQKIERGQRANITLKTLQKLAKAFDSELSINFLR